MCICNKIRNRIYIKMSLLTIDNLPENININENILTVKELLKLVNY